MPGVRNDSTQVDDVLRMFVNAVKTIEAIRLERNALQHVVNAAVHGATIQAMNDDIAIIAVPSIAWSTLSRLATQDVAA